MRYNCRIARQPIPTLAGNCSHPKKPRSVFLGGELLQKCCIKFLEYQPTRAHLYHLSRLLNVILLIIHLRTSQANPGNQSQLYQFFDSTPLCAVLTQAPARKFKVSTIYRDDSTCNKTNSTNVQVAYIVQNK